MKTITNRKLFLPSYMLKSRLTAKQAKKIADEAKYPISKALKEIEYAARNGHKFCEIRPTLSSFVVNLLVELGYEVSHVSGYDRTRNWFFNRYEQRSYTIVTW